MAQVQASVLAWIHLLRVHHQIQRRETAQLAQYNLTLPQFDVLVQLSREEGITQQCLADRLLVTKGNVCGLMDRMVEQGLVERRADPQDRRAYMLYQTPKARALMQKVVPAQSRFIAAQLGKLSPVKQKQLLALLSELDRALAAE
ncbi:MarR family transcriptional regulator [Anaerolineae bacterium CFX7]|nr:MarR family transcriptional regulator [Anaerolineae bacterium CFX7]